MTPIPHLVGRAPATCRAWLCRDRRPLTIARPSSLLAACGGGGGETAGVGTGGTGSFSVGSVTGFGSVFVNGVRFEDNGARLVDDDGTVKVLGSDDNPLKVGMVVEVTGSVDDSGTVRKATQIAYGAELKGPVTAVDVAAGTFDVFGITVRTSTHHSLFQLRWRGLVGRGQRGRSPWPAGRRWPDRRDLRRTRGGQRSGLRDRRRRIPSARSDRQARRRFECGYSFTVRGVASAHRRQHALRRHAGPRRRGQCEAGTDAPG